VVGGTGTSAGGFFRSGGWMRCGDGGGGQSRCEEARLKEGRLCQNRKFDDPDQGRSGVEVKHSMA
jgi:hypothetical protein